MTKPLSELEKYVLRVLNKSIEEYEKDAEEAANNSETKKELNNLSGRTEGMQEIDAFTLDKTFNLDYRTEGLQQVDDFTLDTLTQLQTRIEALENKLNGGNQ